MKAAGPLGRRLFHKLEGLKTGPALSDNFPTPMQPLPPAERREQRRGQRLLFLALVFGVLFNFPLLAVLDHDGRVGGIPVLYLYVLLLWVLVVALTGWLVRKSASSEQ